MALSSSSTDDEILNQYISNCVYEGNATKTALFLEAVRTMIAKFDVSRTFAGRGYTKQSLQELEQKAAAHYMNTVATSNRSTWTKGRVRF